MLSFDRKAITIHLTIPINYMFKMLLRSKAFFLCNEILKNFNILENSQKIWPQSQPGPLATELLIKKSVYQHFITFYIIINYEINTCLLTTFPSTYRNSETEETMKIVSMLQIYIFLKDVREYRPSPTICFCFCILCSTSHGTCKSKIKDGGHRPRFGVAGLQRNVPFGRFSHFVADWAGFSYLYLYFLEKETEEKPISGLFFFIHFIFSFLNIQGVNITFRDRYLQKNLTPTTCPEKTVSDTSM